jgi:hypothetical protein
MAPAHTGLLLLLLQKAAERACKHAIEFVDLPCVHDMVPGRYEGIQLKVRRRCCRRSCCCPAELTCYAIGVFGGLTMQGMGVAGA